MKLFFVFLCTSFLCTVNNMNVMAVNSYDDYKSLCKSYYGLSLTCPANFVTVPEEKSQLNVLFFGQELPELRTRPIFHAGPVVALDNGCHVVMRDLSDVQKPTPESYPDIDANTISNYITPFSGMMLNNCGLPWANWYLTGTGGVLIEGMNGTKPSEATLKDVEDCRKQYIRTVAGTELNNRTNTDRVYIVRIPHVDNIQCCDANFNKTLIGNNFECYGVEFYRADRYDFIGMLFFVNTKNGKTIDDYVEQMSHYISFDKDFTLGLKA